MLEANRFAIDRIGVTLVQLDVRTLTFGHARKQ
jgi:hypothetical protein